MIARLFGFSLCLFITPWALAASTAVPVPFTVLHTNDVHSHFRSDKSPLKLGGVARLKTMIQAARAENRDSLLVDGGDWSEGQIYYVEGGGAESLRMMDLLGYDAAVVGNHDWLNGPDRLIEASHASGARIKLIGANFDVTGFANAAAFNAAIIPYTIKTVAGIRVAFVGLANFDPVYGPYLSPVRVTDPVVAAERQAAAIKASHLAEIVIGVSHNAINVNRDILVASPSMDLIIGAHDHQALRHEVVVERPGHPNAWVVEAGKWGQYLGELKLIYTPAIDGTPASLALDGYRLRQIDRHTAENEEVKALVDALETRIEARMGPIFHDHVADCELEIGGDGLETPVGDFATDAYRQATGADVALEQNRLVYGSIPSGALSSVDFFNAIPPIYHLARQKTWTLQTFTLSGAMAATLFRLLYTWRKITATGGLSFSGLEVMYDPLTQKENLGASDLFGGFFARAVSPVHALTVGGRPVESNRSYKFAASSGIVATIQLMNQQYYNMITLHDITETGIENWRAVREYARTLTSVTAAKINYGGRIRTWQADLGFVPGSLRWSPQHTQADGAVVARVEVTVRNYGGNPSDANATVGIAANYRGTDNAIDPQWVGLSVPTPIRALAPGETQAVTWESAIIPGDSGLYPLSAFIHATGETNLSNDSIGTFFVL